LSDLAKVAAGSLVAGLDITSYAEIDKNRRGKERQPIASQTAALIQFAVCRASSAAAPKKSRNIVKFVPGLIFITKPPLLTA
jgi:hypothetical protein